MKTAFLTVLGGLSLALISTTSNASVTVVGGSYARSCFEAADSPGARFGLEACDRALAAEGLTHYDEVATYVNRGILKLRRGDRGAAIADFDAAMALDPNHPEAYLNKGIALLRQPDQLDQALSLITASLEKKTSRPAVAYLARGFAHEDKGNIKSAYLDYRAASRADPRWKDPRMELARFRVDQR